MFCISLARRKDRRKEALEQLNRTGMPWEFFDAVDGRNLDADALARRGVELFPGWMLPSSPNPFHRREMKLGEIGCSISHHLVWKTASERNLPWAIVVEDDLDVGRNFKQRFDDCLEALAARRLAWDLIYLGRTASRDGENVVSPGIVKPNFSYTAVGYVLSARGIEKVLRANLIGNLIPVDEFLPALYVDHPRDDVRKHFASAPRLDAFAIVPDVIRQARLDSDTEATSFVSNRVPSLRTVLRISADARLSWVDDSCQIESRAFKGSARTIDAESATTAFALLNAFALPATCQKAFRAVPPEVTKQELLEAVGEFVTAGILEVVRW